MGRKESHQTNQIISFLSRFHLGTLKIHEMMNTDYKRIDEIKFYALNIRNRGTVNMDNNDFQHFLNGTIMQILPGGTLTAKNLRVDVEMLIIDVMAEMDASNNGYCNMGKYNLSHDM